MEDAAIELGAVKGTPSASTTGPGLDNDTSWGTVIGPVGRPKSRHHVALGGGCADDWDEIDAEELATCDGESMIISAEISGTRLDGRFAAGVVACWLLIIAVDEKSVRGAKYQTMPHTIISDLSQYIF